MFRERVELCTTSLNHFWFIGPGHVDRGQEEENQSYNFLIHELDLTGSFNLLKQVDEADDSMAHARGVALAAT